MSVVVMFIISLLYFFIFVYFFLIFFLYRTVHLVVFCYFFFFKQKTAYEMRISDWSSDVCSSDLMMRDAGASEVHFRVASPPTGHGCYYGVDTPERSKLLAGRMDVAAMCEFIHADSLAFVSIDGLYRAVGLAGRNNARPQYCDACFTEIGRAHV